MGVKGLAASAVLVVAAGLCASAAHAQPAGLWLIEDPPGQLAAPSSVSGDGRVVGGRWGDVGFLWTRAGGRVDLTFGPGPLNAALVGGLNHDGSIIGGSFGGQAARRVGNGPFERLGVLPGSTGTEGHALSRDGSTVAGWAYYPSGDIRSFRWTQATGMVEVAGGLGLGFEVLARAVSGDGLVVVGDSSQAGRGWVWKDGVTTLLPGSLTVARGVSADGRWVVGGEGGDFNAARWDLVTGQVQLLNGLLPGFSTANAVSDDGRTIVGSGPGTACIWREGVGAQTLEEFARAAGFTLPPGSTFYSARAISADGRTITGVAREPLTSGGRFRGFVLTVPTPGGVVVVMGIAGVFASRRRR